MKAAMNGVAHSAAGHRMIDMAVRKIMRKREVCLGVWRREVWMG